MQVCTSLQTDNHASTPTLFVFLQAGCPSCRPTNSVKALKAQIDAGILTITSLYKPSSKAQVSDQTVSKSLAEYVDGQCDIE